MEARERKYVTCTFDDKANVPVYRRAFRDEAGFARVTQAIRDRGTYKLDYPNRVVETSSTVLLMGIESIARDMSAGSTSAKAFEDGVEAFKSMAARAFGTRLYEKVAAQCDAATYLVRTHGIEGCSKTVEFERLAANPSAIPSAKANRQELLQRQIRDQQLTRRKIKSASVAVGGNADGPRRASGLEGTEERAVRQMRETRRRVEATRARESRQLKR